MMGNLKKRRRVHKGWVSECILMAWHTYKVRVNSLTVSSGPKLEESLKKKKSKSAKVISKKKM